MEVKKHILAIFIDEISMLSAKLLLQTHQRLCEIFGTYLENINAMQIKEYK